MKSFFRTIFTLFILAAFSAFAWANPMLAPKGNPTATGYNIKLKVKGVADTTCLLAYHYGNQIFVQDTFYLDKKGVCVFKGDTALHGGIYLAVLPGTKYFEFIVDNNEQHFSMETDPADFVGTLQINGSPTNTLFNEYQRFLKVRQPRINELMKELAQLDTLKADSVDKKAVRDQILPLEEEIKQYRLQFIKQHPKNFLSLIFKTMQEPEVPAAPKGADGKPLDPDFNYKYFKAHFLDNVNLTDKRLVRTPLLHGKINTYLEKLTYKVPDSIFVSSDLIIDKTLPCKECFKYALSYITHYYESAKIMGMDAVFVHLAKRYYLPGKAFWMDEKRMDKVRERVRKLEPNLIGSVAPNIRMLNINDNQPKNLHDIKSDYTILMFWSHNCGHCKKSMPSFVDLYNKYKNKGVSVFSVNTEVEADKMKEYLKEAPQPWDNYYDPTNASRFRDLYDIYSTPVIYLLDKDKKIKVKRVDVEQLDKILDNLINGKEMGKVEEKEDNH
jgi:thiol-disulfide isomerase/thioredoxin